MPKNYFIYIATNKNNTVLYTGITNNIERRVFEHKHKIVSGFSSKYNVLKLVYYESFLTPTEAILAEKKIKGWTRQKKINLIINKNPKFEDLLDPSADASG